MEKIHGAVTRKCQGSLASTHCDTGSPLRVRLPNRSQHGARRRVAKAGERRNGARLQQPGELGAIGKGGSRSAQHLDVSRGVHNACRDVMGMVEQHLIMAKFETDYEIHDPFMEPWACFRL